MIAGLILAAGESSRMGTPKATLAYRGRTFLELIVETLRSAGLERIVVVLGHRAGEIQPRVKRGGYRSSHQSRLPVRPDFLIAGGTAGAGWRMIRKPSCYVSWTILRSPQRL